MEIKEIADKIEEIGASYKFVALNPYATAFKEGVAELRKIENGVYEKVVRCKDCKNKGKVFCPRLYASDSGQGYYARYENSCSFGERG